MTTHPARCSRRSRYGAAARISAPRLSQQLCAGSRHAYDRVLPARLLLRLVVDLEQQSGGPQPGGRDGSGFVTGEADGA